ncbi:MAG TPA: hypothetical protein VMV29_02365 [Ktedonobacterales bacterium]|nr:hypothetical protein [Ktedonobacterales bacterium]
MEIASLVELVVGALTGLHGVGWLMRRRWKVGLVSLGLSILVNVIFAVLIIPSAGFALIPQLSLQIGWGLFSANALNNELRKPTQPPAPRNAPFAQLPYPLQPPYPPYQQPTPQRQPQPARQPQQAQPPQQPYQPYQPPIGYPQPAPPSQQPVAPGPQRQPQPPQQRQPQSPYPTPYPPDAPTWRN